MNLTYPIRNYKDVERLKKYFLDRKEYRNYLLIVFCLNTALRISDIIGIKWEELMKGSAVKSHIMITERKTGKSSKVFINKQIKEAIQLYMKNRRDSVYVFDNGMDSHITRAHAHRIIHSAGKACGIGDNISCHSLRKTFGYHAWKKGVPPALLMEIYNHSSYNVTKRYLGIMQEDKDSVFNKVML